MPRILLLLLLTALLLPAGLEAKSSRGPSTASRARSNKDRARRAARAHSRVNKGRHKVVRPVVTARPAKRSSQARTEFRKSNPCPATGKSTGACPGYVIDHKQALKRGGADAPSNMQWQTTQAAKAKDRVE